MVWIQYTLADGIQQATCSDKVDDDALASVGRAQIECLLDNPEQYNVDITQNPPAIIPNPYLQG